MANEMDQTKISVLNMWSRMGNPQNFNGKQASSVWGNIYYIPEKFTYLVDSTPQYLTNLNQQYVMANNKSNYVSR